MSQVHGWSMAWYLDLMPSAPMLGYCCVDLQIRGEVPAWPNIFVAVRRAPICAGSGEMLQGGFHAA